MYDLPRLHGNWPMTSPRRSRSTTSRMYGRTSMVATADAGTGTGVGSYVMRSAASICSSDCRRSATCSMFTMACTRPSMGVCGLVQRHLTPRSPSASVIAVKVE